MLNPLPVPIEVDLPGPEWTLVTDPEQYGVHDVVLMATRGGLGGDFAPTVTISGGIWPYEATAEDAAGLALADFAEQVGGPVEVRERQVTDEGRSGVAQLLEATTDLDGTPIVLDQIQIVERRDAVALGDGAAGPVSPTGTDVAAGTTPTTPGGDATGEPVDGAGGVAIDSAAPGERRALGLVYRLTALREQMDVVAPELQRLIASVRIDA
jgi:hypothetical protein